jgi:hypothetical protein
VGIPARIREIRLTEGEGAMNTITIELSGPAAAKLRELAASENRSEAEILTDALESYAPRPRKRVEPSTRQAGPVAPSKFCSGLFLGKLPEDFDIDAVIGEMDAQWKAKLGDLRVEP